MDTEILEEFYENCLKSEDVYYEYAFLIFESLNVDPENVSNYICNKALATLSSNGEDMSKYISILFIRDAVLENNLQSQYAIFNSEIVSFIVEALQLLEGKKDLKKLEPIISDEQINIKFHKIMILIFYEARQLLSDGQIEQFDKYYNELLQKNVKFDMAEKFQFLYKQQYKKDKQQEDQQELIDKNEIQKQKDHKNDNDQDEIENSKKSEDENKKFIQEINKQIEEKTQLIKEDFTLNQEQKKIKLQTQKDLQSLLQQLQNKKIGLKEFKIQKEILLDKDNKIIFEEIESQNQKEHLQNQQTPQKKNTIQDLTEDFENKINIIQSQNSFKKTTKEQKPEVKEFKPVSLNFYSQIQQIQAQQKNDDQINKSNFKIFKPHYNKIKSPCSNITLSYKKKIKKNLFMKKIDSQDIIKNQQRADQKQDEQNVNQLQNIIDKQKIQIAQKQNELYKLERQNLQLKIQLEEQNKNSSRQEELQKKSIEQQNNVINMKIKQLQGEKQDLIQKNQQLNDKIQIQQEQYQKQLNDKFVKTNSSKQFKIFDQSLKEVELKQSKVIQLNDLQFTQQIMQQNKKAIIKNEISWNDFYLNKVCLIMQFEELEVYIKPLKRFQDQEKPHIKFGIAFKNISGTQIKNLNFNFDPLVSSDYQLMVNKKNFSETINCFEQKFLTVILYLETYIENLPNLIVNYNFFEDGRMLQRNQKTQLKFEFNTYIVSHIIDSNFLSYDVLLEKQYTQKQIVFNQNFIKNLDTLIEIFPGAQIQKQMLNTVCLKFNIVTEPEKIIVCFFILNNYQNTITIGIKKDENQKDNFINFIQQKLSNNLLN